jgi:secondary thiamine-phosphate synthase enzyme
MQTVAPTQTCRHTRVRIDTERPTQFVDLTTHLQAFVAASGMQTGLLNVQSLHTTAAIVVNEHEPLLLTDMAGLLDRLAPVDAVYRHDNITLRTVNCVLSEPPNGHSHCRALLLGSTAALNVVDGELQLGRWQRVFLVELDGPRTRDVSLLLVGNAREGQADSARADQRQRSV